MVLHDVEQIGCRHLGQIRMKKLAGERRLRLSDGGLQQAQIANSTQAAVTSKLVAMDFQHLIERQEVRRHASIRQLLQGSAILAIGFLKSLTEFGLLLRVFRRTYNQQVSV